MSAHHCDGALVGRQAAHSLGPALSAVRVSWMCPWQQAADVGRGRKADRRSGGRLAEGAGRLVESQ
eukprot:13960869-Alexandrium_andersonii.AAC.1